MKKKLLISAMIILLLSACTLFISDGWIYLITSLMALIVMGVIRANRSLVMKITRWSKANPGKTQVFITLVQICLIVLGILGGYNLKMLGYEISSTTALVFSTIMVAGFFCVHFLPKHRNIAIPAKVNKNRLAFMCIAISSFVLMLVAGNRLQDQYPNAAITSMVSTIDHAIFNDDAEYNRTAFFEQPEHESVAAAFTTNPKNNSSTITDFIEKIKAKLMSGKKVTSLEKKKVRMLS